MGLSCILVLSLCRRKSMFWGISNGSKVKSANLPINRMAFAWDIRSIKNELFDQSLHLWILEKYLAAGYDFFSETPKAKQVLQGSALCSRPSLAAGYFNLLVRFSETIILTKASQWWKLWPVTSTERAFKDKAHCFIFSKKTVHAAFRCYGHRRPHSPMMAASNEVYLLAIYCRKIGANKILLQDKTSSKSVGSLWLSFPVH